MSHFLPPVENGKLLYVDEGESLMKFLEMLSPLRKVQAERLIRNEGYTVRKALERVGVMICDRAPKPRKVPERVISKETDDI